MEKRPYINKSYVRTRNQKRVMDQIDEEGVCPFCGPNLERFHGKSSVKKSKHWSLLESKWPYKKTRIHLLFVAKKHMEHIEDLSATSWSDLLQMAKWSIKKYKLKGGAFAIRFGDSNLTGATVHHLHAHLIEPETDRKGMGEVVNFPIG